jgi:hypothetical protein
MDKMVSILRKYKTHPIVQAAFASYSGDPKGGKPGGQ